MKYKQRAVLTALGLLGLLFLFINGSSFIFIQKQLPTRLKNRPEESSRGYDSQTGQESNKLVFVKTENKTNRTVVETKHSRNIKNAHVGQVGFQIVSENKDAESPKVEMYDEKVQELLNRVNNMDNAMDTDAYADMSFANLAKALGSDGRAGAPGFKAYLHSKITSSMPYYKQFHRGIRKYFMYTPGKVVNGLLRAMANKTVKDVEMLSKGTQLKLIMTLSDGAQALFKAMRWSRDTNTQPDHFYFNDYERHNAEIAAFHLDRLLGFYRVPPTAGRKFNMTTEIFALAPSKLQKTFFISPANNLCFYGDCSYYCDSRHPFCGDGDIIEGSLMVFLPPSMTTAPRSRWRNPWRRSYSKFKKAEWEHNSKYCARIRKQKPYNEGRVLLDVMDMHIFDFLTGNMDRHHLETFKEFTNQSFLIHLDNGRGFGKPHQDDMSILAPVIQCCLIRESTYMKLTKLYLGPERLSDLMHDSLQKDVLENLLPRPHLDALDRRVIKILRTIAECVEQGNPIEKVIVADKF